MEINCHKKREIEPFDGKKVTEGGGRLKVAGGWAAQGGCRVVWAPDLKSNVSEFKSDHHLEC